MRRHSLVLTWACALLLFEAGRAAAQIDNLTNLSAEWIRTSNRNAATDAADIVVYNPAALPRLGEGFHLSLSNQSLIRRPKHEFDLGGGADTLAQTSEDWLLPSVYASYVHGGWAMYGGVYVPGGGASVDYPQGSITTRFLGHTLMELGMAAGFRDDSLEASSMYVAATAGVARDLGDRVSVSAALRYLHARNTLKARAEFLDVMQSGLNLDLGLDVASEADGIGAVLGLHLRPVDKLSIGLRYESEVRLEFQNDVRQDDFSLMLNREKSRRDFPAMFGGGVAYALTDALTAEADFNWFFQKQADWGEDDLGRDYADLAGDCYSAGGALSYAATEKLLLSAGALYTKFLWNDIDAYYTNQGAFEVLYSDNVNLGTGLVYEIVKDVRLNAGVAWTLWTDETIGFQQGAPMGMDMDVSTRNSTFTGALGIAVDL